MSSCGSSSYIIDDDKNRRKMDSLFYGSPDGSGTAPKPYSERNLPASFYRQPQAEQKRKNGNGHHVKSQLSLPGTLLPTRVSPSHNHWRTVSDSAALGGQAVINAKLPSNNGQFPGFPLPDGWERRQLPDGQLYYIDHVTHTTTWTDPRPSHYAAFQSYCTSLQLPDGYIQKRDAHGNIYFVDQKNGTTHWDDPRPNHYRALMTKRLGVSPAMPPSSAENLLAKQLMTIAAEREALILRTKELEKKEADIRKRLNQPHDAKNHMASNPTAQQVAINDWLSHTRQSSVDSGLGDGPHTASQTLDVFSDFVDSVLLPESTDLNDFPMDISYSVLSPQPNLSTNQSQSKPKSNVHTQQQPPRTYF